MPQRRSAIVNFDRDVENLEVEHLQSSESDEGSSPTSSYFTCFNECVEKLREWAWEALCDFYGDFWEEAASWLKWRLCDYLFALVLMYW
jgi:hypothetical protein